MTWRGIVIGALLLTTVGRADEFDTLRQQWFDLQTGGSSLNLSDPLTAAAVTSLANSANATWSSLNKSAGRSYLWSDLASTTVSADISSNYTRVRSLALAYATTGSTLQGDAALRSDILGALDWLYANRYNETKSIYDNWWDWEIGTPKLLVDIATLMFDDLSAAQLAHYMRAVDKFTPSATAPAAGGTSGTFTGANRADKIYAVAIRGILVKDAAKIANARDAFSNLFLYVTSGDGFYVDGSFIQHTRHPYTGSYGAVLLDSMASILTLLNGPNAASDTGSTWRVTDPNLSNVYQWIYQGYQPVIYRGGMMAMLQGRAVSRSATSEHSLGHGIMQNILRISQLAPPGDRARMRAMLRTWAESDTSRSFAGTAPLPLIAPIEQLLADPTVSPRGELLGSFVFGSMDRIVHLAPGWGMGLSLSSSRIYNYESINNENLHGWYTGDGMTYLYNADLTHFSDSFWPTVNPRRLPGTTVDATQARSDGSGQSTTSPNNWVGGAALARYAAAGMQLRGWNNTLTAKKSWFMFDHEVVCLGSGISSTDNRTIETTVDNRLLTATGSNVFTADGAPKPTSLGWSETETNLHWAHLAGRVAGADIGYYFPGAATVKALREARSGAWSDIKTGGATTSLTRNYQTLWFDHGTNPLNATYAYVLLPGRSATEVADYAANPGITVLENSANIHAVRQAALGVVAANFWTDGTASAGGITVDRKASVVMQSKAGVLEIAVSDPTQANTSMITVELATSALGTISADSGVNVTQLSPTVRLTVDVKAAAGRSFRARFSLAQNQPPVSLLNLSTRAYIASASDTIIAGFVIGGSGTKSLLIRAVGPTLGPLGVTGALANPRLAVVDSSGAIVAENDNWGTGAADLATAFQVAGAFPLATGSQDAAVKVTLPPGGYSAVVRSADATGGVALVEIYDLAQNSAAWLTNLSTRAYSGSGNQAAIVGFGLGGTAPQQLLVRAIGPSLANYGVSGPLADPQLQVVNAAGAPLAHNDNWAAAVLAPEIAAAAAGVGAFVLPAAGKDAAGLVSLAPGTYTALVTGIGSGTGQVLVEVYATP